MRGRWSALFAEVAMNRVMACGMAAMVCLTALVSAGARTQDEVPTPYAGLEPMVGGWKGTARPSANKVKGWQETHSWAWKFVKGNPVGMTLTVEGGKVFTKGDLSFDTTTRRYKLAATDPAGKPVTFVGPAGPEGKGLILDRVETSQEGRERLTIRPTSNNIRYTMLVDRQPPGAPQFKNVIEVGLTKEGESFAAGGGASDLPKCIITGGAAAMTVSFNGKTFPICCTGCRDEFNDNPEKYIARFAARAAAEGDKPATAAKPAATGRGDGEFDGLVEAPKAKAKAMPKGSAKPKADEAGDDKPAAKPAPKKDASDLAGRALRLGQAYERGGKAKQALDSYREVVKKYPDSDAAKTAAARIKALDKP